MSNPVIVTTNKTLVAISLICREQGASISELAKACGTEERNVYAIVSRVKKRIAHRGVEVYKTAENRDTVWKTRTKR